MDETGRTGNDGYQRRRKKREGVGETRRKGKDTRRIPRKDTKGSILRKDIKEGRPTGKKERRQEKGRTEGRKKRGKKTGRQEKRKAGRKAGRKTG
jgi:hypothetical protein